MPHTGGRPLRVPVRPKNRWRAVGVVADCVADICDVDGSPLIIRSDDREEVIRERLQTYDRQTRPVAEYYEHKGRLVSVNGDLPVGEVTGQMFYVIEHRDGNCL